MTVKTAELESPGAPSPALLLMAILLMLVAGCRSGQRRTAPPAPPPSLLCGPASDATARPCQLSLFAVEPDDGIEPLVLQFAAARTSIEYVPFALDEPAILLALREAQARGVRVRVLLEPAPSDDAKYGQRTMQTLRRIGIEVREANPAFALTHAKYAVIDDARALILTLNSSTDDLATHRDVALADENPDDIAFVRSLFAADWDRQPLGKIPPGFVVSPENANQQLTGLVDSATKSLDVYAEKLMPSPLFDRIVVAAGRGVKVRILAAPLDPKDRVADAMREAQRSGQFEIRVLRRPRVHAKVMLVDGATVFVGSENVQDGPKEKRRELGIIFDETQIAGQLAALFERDWAAPSDPFH